MVRHKVRIRQLVWVPLAGLCLTFLSRPVELPHANAQQTAATKDLSVLKEALTESIRQREQVYWDAALKIWKWAEPGYQEEQSANLLAEILAAEGFTIRKGVAGIPTAFMAEFGSGKPVLALLGEYDALPGLSQQAVPHREPIAASGNGHGCGHHLFGVASAAAAIAVAERIRTGELKGTIRFYGCPAEEGGAAKAFMVRDGLFQDCDVALHWHPSSKNQSGDRRNLSRIAVKFRFHGKSAHAAGAPEQGRSALDAVELTNHAAQLLREHTPDGTRIHHVITHGGGAPNVVPDFAEVYYYVRHPRSETVRDLYRRLVLCARAGELATETKLEIDYQGGTVEMLPNRVLGDLCGANLRRMNDLEYSEDDLLFARQILTTVEKPGDLASIRHVSEETDRLGMGSTDVSDVSWTIPTSGFSTACFVPGVPGHSWQAVACGGTPIGRRGMILAARVLAATAADLFSQPQIIAAAKDELRQRVGETPYRSLMEPNQKPPLDYRKPAVGSSPPP